MTVELRPKCSDGDIPAKDLANGQIAEIIEHSHCEYIGWLVQGQVDRVITIGRRETSSWAKNRISFRVKVLPDDEYTLAVRNNQ